MFEIVDRNWRGDRTVPGAGIPRGPHNDATVVQVAGARLASRPTPDGVAVPYGGSPRQFPGGTSPSSP